MLWITDSLHGTPETNPTLKINYNPIQIFKKSMLPFSQPSRHSLLK